MNLRRAGRILAAPRLVGLAALLVSAAFAPATGAQSSLLGDDYVETLTTTIGSDGTLYRVQSGIQLDLFPEDPKAGWSNVLALDVVREGALAERIVIPGTEGPDVESSAAVVFDNDQLFVLWQSRASANRSFLDLIQFTPASTEWGEVIEVSGDPLPIKGPPQLAITREALSAAVIPSEEQAEESESGPSESETRTVVHVLWWESPAPEELQVLYTPIILTDGAFLGWNPVVALDPADLPTSEGAAGSEEFASDLLLAATLDRGTDPRSVVVAFPSGESGKLHNLIVRLLPDALVDLAEHARSSIVGVGLINVGDVGDLGSGGPGDLIDIAEHARSSIVGVGRIPLHRGVREYVGGRVFSRIVALESLYQEDREAFWAEVDSVVWDEVLTSGASILGNQLQNEDLPCGILHLGEGGLVTAGSEATESVHQLEFCLGSEFPLPTTANESGQEHHLLVSENATEAVVAWQDEDGAIRYRQTEDGAWGAALTVPDSELSLTEALKILSRKVRTH